MGVKKKKKKRPSTPEQAEEAAAPGPEPVEEVKEYTEDQETKSPKLITEKSDRPPMPDAIDESKVITDTTEPEETHKKGEKVVLKKKKKKQPSEMTSEPGENDNETEKEDSVIEPKPIGRMEEDKDIKAAEKTRDESSLLIESAPKPLVGTKEPKVSKNGEDKA